MSLITRAYDRWLFSILLILSIVSFAAPHASQEDASDEFILFTSDRAFPSQDGRCTACEDIYVMPPPGNCLACRMPIRLTFGSGIDRRVLQQCGADWSRAKKLIAFQSNRPTDPQSPAGARAADLPDEPRRDRAATPRQPPRGAQFPSFSHNGNELCFQSQTMPRGDIYIVHVHGTGLTNLTSRGRPRGSRARPGTTFVATGRRKATPSPSPATGTTRVTRRWTRTRKST